MSARLTLLMVAFLLASLVLSTPPATAADPAQLQELATSKYAAKNVRGFFSATYEGQTLDAPEYKGRLRFTFKAGRSKLTPGFLLGTGNAPPAYLTVKVKRGTYKLFETGVYDDDQEHTCEVDRKRARFQLFIGARRVKRGFRVGWPHPTLASVHLLPRSCWGFNEQLDGIDPSGETVGRVTERRLSIRQLSARSRIVVLRGKRTIKTARKYQWQGKGTATIKWRMRFRLVRVR